MKAEAGTPLGICIFCFIASNHAFRVGKGFGGFLLGVVAIWMMEEFFKEWKRK